MCRICLQMSVREMIKDHVLQLSYSFTLEELNVSSLLSIVSLFLVTKSCFYEKNMKKKKGVEYVL